MMNQVDSSSLDDDKDDDKRPKRMISRFKRRLIQDSREEIKKTSQGKY